MDGSFNSRRLIKNKERQAVELRLLNNTPSSNRPISTGTLVSQKTPVLYTTNCGLHLRTFTERKNTSTKGYGSDRLYETRFCDLEKWVSDNSL